MKIDTTRIALAKQIAGVAPRGSEVIGLITQSDDFRDMAALVRMQTGIYVSMMGQSIRSIDQRRVEAALAAATLGKIGGAATSERKTQAARRNATQPAAPGKKRGRPKAESGYAIAWDDRGTMKIHGDPEDASEEFPSTTKLYDTREAAQADIDANEWHNCSVIKVTRLTPNRIDYEPLK